MVRLSLITLALSAVTLASPAKRAQALSVSPSGPATVSSIADLKLTATVVNSGAEDVKILKYGTVLDADTPIRSFHISKDGIPANFTGVKISLDLDQIGDEAFIAIPAGQSYSVEQEGSVSALYDFESLSTGSYSIEPVTTFQIWFNETVSVSQAKAQIGTEAVFVEVMGDISKRELLASKEKRVSVSCSSSSYKRFISSSYSEGKSLASIASSYVSSNGANSLFKSYFGTTCYQCF